MPEQPQPTNPAFASLGLRKDIVAALRVNNRINPIDVQQAVIPLALQKKNIVFIARTGSGKTLAFLLGYLGSINPKLGLQMLIIVPTRELCIQVGKECATIADPLGIRVGTLYGGRPIGGDYRTTKKKIQILVGTPGRLVQHINEKHIKPGEVKYLVFDESDQMFDDGFAEECAYIAERCNKYVQMVLASATITEKVKDFIKTVIPTHELLQVGELIPENITQEKLYCSKEDKPDIVLRFLTKQKIRRALVFCNTKVKCTELASFLAANNIYTYQLSSSLDQKGRINTLNLFKDGKIRVLVATDMAARGLHMLNVDCIINYDLPTRQEFYIHRIGRTGRDNKPGRSLSLVCPEDVERMRQLEEIYKLNIQLMPWDDN